MKQIFNKYIILILGVYAFWIGGVPVIFTKALPVICENISINSNYNVEILNPTSTPKTIFAKNSATFPPVFVTTH